MIRAQRAPQRLLDASEQQLPIVRRVLHHDAIARPHRYGQRRPSRCGAVGNAGTATVRTLKSHSYPKAWGSGRHLPPQFRGLAAVRASDGGRRGKANRAIPSCSALVQDLIGDARSSRLPLAGAHQQDSPQNRRCSSRAHAELPTSRPRPRTPPWAPKVNIIASRRRPIGRAGASPQAFPQSPLFA